MGHIPAMLLITAACYAARDRLYRLFRSGEGWLWINVAIFALLFAVFLNTDLLRLYQRLAPSQHAIVARRRVKGSSTPILPGRRRCRNDIYGAEKLDWIGKALDRLNRSSYNRRLNR
jgi:hypothetical protein